MRENERATERERERERGEDRFALMVWGWTVKAGYDHVSTRD